MVRNADLTDPSNLPLAAEYSPASATPPVPNTHPRLMAVLAFALYQVIAIIFFGRLLLGHFGSLIAGQSSDPGLYIWFLEWWLYAVSHHLNPFLTRLVWAPVGFNVAWSTSIPLLSLITAPVTVSMGPVVAFN